MRVRVRQSAECTAALSCWCAEARERRGSMLSRADRAAAETAGLSSRAHGGGASQRLLSVQNARDAKETAGLLFCARGGVASQRLLSPQNARDAATTARLSVSSRGDARTRAGLSVSPPRDAATTARLLFCARGWGRESTIAVVSERARRERDSRTVVLREGVGVRVNDGCLFQPRRALRRQPDSLFRLRAALRRQSDCSQVLALLHG
jgi:hypothetical protein